MGIGIFWWMFLYSGKRTQRLFQFRIYELNLMCSEGVIQTYKIVALEFIMFLFVCLFFFCSKIVWIGIVNVIRMEDTEMDVKKHIISVFVHERKRKKQNKN